jgi:hypothetical protein
LSNIILNTISDVFFLFNIYEREKLRLKNIFKRNNKLEFKFIMSAQYGCGKDTIDQKNAQK